MNKQNISDEYLNSFVDDQLDSIEKINTFDIINQNEFKYSSEMFCLFIILSS